MPLMSQRAYARHRAEQGLPGTTHRAVQKAIEAGRIQVNEKGQIDSDQADRQWAANSSEGHRRNPAQEEAAKAKAKATPPAKVAAAEPKRRPAPAKAPPPPPARPPAPPPREALPPSESGHEGMSLAEASALEKIWKARLAELDFEERSGKLVPANEVQAKWVELVTLSKTKLLALPSKIKARIPSLTVADVAVIDELIRGALEELAETGAEEEGDDG